VKSAFFHEELEEEIYIKQPEGFTVLGKEKLCLPLEEVSIWPKTSTAIVV